MPEDHREPHRRRDATRSSNAVVRLKLIVSMAAAAGLAGCAGSTLETAGLPTPSQLKLPVVKLPEAPKLSDIELPKASKPVVGTPTEVYERVGRGAVSCWLGAGGPLKGTHIYDAEAEPAHKGGAAEIVIRERDENAPNPRSVRAYRISIQPGGSETATVEVENLKLPESLARQMKSNVEAWSAGEEGCAAGGEVAGAAPAATDPAAGAAQAAAAPGVKAAEAKPAGTTARPAKP